MFPLTAPVNDPKGTLSALIGVHITSVHDLVGLNHGEKQGTSLCQSCWELSMSSVLNSSFMTTVFRLEAKYCMPWGLHYSLAA